MMAKRPPLVQVMLDSVKKQGDYYHDSGGYGGCGQNNITVEVPVAVMVEFIRQIRP